MDFALSLSSFLRFEAKRKVFSVFARGSAYFFIIIRNNVMMNKFVNCELRISMLYIYLMPHVINRKFHLSTTALFLFCLVAVCHSSSILSLNSENFEGTLNEHNPILIQFYSPGCSFCKAFELEFNKLGEKVQSLPNNKFILAKLDCESEPDIASKHGIVSYPTLLLLDDGDTFEYKGARDAESIYNWISLYFQARWQKIDKKYEESLQTPYIIFIAESIQSEILDKNLKALHKAAFENMGIRYFYRIEEISSKNKFSLELRLKTRSIQFSSTDEPYEFPKLRKWIEAMSMNTIIPLNNEQNLQKVLFQSHTPVLVVIFGKDDDRKNQKVYDVIEDLCEGKKETIYCAEIRRKDEAFNGAHDFFRNSNSNETLIGILKDQMKIAYSYQESFETLTQQKLKEFVDLSFEDKIKRTVDDSIPTIVEFKVAPIFDNVTFEQTVQNNTYVFMNFYHPSDEGSKQFALRYDAFYEEMASRELEEGESSKVVVGSLNCEDYSELCESKMINYYPTLRLYIRGLSVQFPKDTKIPHVQPLVTFVNEKLRARPTVISSKQEITQKNAVVFIGKEVNDIIIRFSQVFSKYPVFFLNKEESGEIYSLHFHFDGEVHQYEGSFYIREIEEWIKIHEGGEKLSDLLEEEPDAKVVKTIKQRQPIICLLDIERSKSERYRATLGHIAKKLNFCGGFADRKHQAFMSFIEWLGFSKETVKGSSKIVYSQTITDKKYLYPYPLDDLNSESMELFLKQVRNNQIPEIGSEDRKIKIETNDETQKQAVQEEL